jgi:hypothetical protein
MAIGNGLTGMPTVQIKSREQVLMEQELEKNKNLPAAEEPIVYDDLVNHMITEFHENRRSKINSGIEKDITDSRRANLGLYSTEDIQRIKATGGSTLYMNITATKSRAAKSWIADVLKPPKGDPWSLEPTPMEDLPNELKAMIKEALEKEFEESINPAPAQEQAALGEGRSEQPQPQQPGIEEAQVTLREANQKKRDIEKAVSQEITEEAQWQLNRMEKKIKDQLVEGNWDKALTDFLDDFVVDPAAIMKGPVISKKKALAWKDGAPVEVESYKFMNERVDCLDIYPSSTARGLHDGNLFEHMRLDEAMIGALQGLPEKAGYIDAAISKVLEEFGQGIMGSWVDTGIEQDKADLERRGSFIDSSRGIVHALHFWGNLPISTLRKWEYFEKIRGLEDKPDHEVVAVEAMLVGNHLIKCVVNDDPLKRRPYYKASFMNVPGSFWGKSLPMLMSPTQRMCNAAARALSNNMGIASGPQVEIYIDRLADNGPIEEVVPFKIWQLKSDPTGAGGRAINFWQPTSNAAELLKVYNEFERKADDVTGIPQYAYGNEKTAGATNTAAGLAMLLESTSKIIKDCIRNIDEGLIKPRIMFQFHQNMLTDDDFNYTGDINVQTIGSKTLSVRGAEATRRNEFLQATANPTDMAVMGVEGRSAILRSMAEDLGLPAVIPTEYELKQKQKKLEAAQAEQAKAEAEAEQAKSRSGIEATTIQIEGQKEMHQVTMQKEMAKIQADLKKHTEALQLEVKDLQRKMQNDQANAATTVMAEEGKNSRQNQEVAVKLKKGEGI